MTSGDMANRVRGCLLGGAVGDALGAPVEFMSLQDIRQRFGPSGVTKYVELDGDRGAITDDTQMTLFTAEGLIRGAQRFVDRGICNPLSVIGLAYRRWLATQEAVPESKELWGRGWLVDAPALQYGRAPGATCMVALKAAEPGAPPKRAMNDSKGCGGVMRVAPIGLAVARVDRASELGLQAAGLTHGHATGQCAASALVVMIHRLAAGASMPEAVEAGRQDAAARTGGAEVVEALRAAVGLAARERPSAETVEQLGGGWVAEEALAIACYCALVTRDFTSAIILASNHSGDSDSTASIAGQLVATHLGVDAIPSGWLEGLVEHDVIERLAEDFVVCFVDEGELSLQSYPPN